MAPETTRDAASYVAAVFLALLLVTMVMAAIWPEK